MNLPAFKILEDGEDVILIRDMSNVVIAPSITNAAEIVVEQIYGMGILGYKRLFYIDTMGGVDELLHNDRGVFMGFKYGFQSEDDFRKQWFNIKKG